jgi:hypothetical protein
MSLLANLTAYMYVAPHLHDTRTRSYLTSTPTSNTALPLEAYGTKKCACCTHQKPLQLPHNTPTCALIGREARGERSKQEMRRRRWANEPRAKRQKKKTKTYNRRDSQMVTHSSTSRPVQCLCMAERTGCPVLTDLWSYVLTGWVLCYILTNGWGKNAVSR